MMDSFNDLMKKLEGAGSRNDDDKVSQLAQRLLAQGLATSMMEAKEKAKSMVSVDSKSMKDITQKTKQLTQYNDPRSNPEYYRKQNIDDYRRRALENRGPTRIQTEFQTPGYEQKYGSAGLPRPVVTSMPREAEPREETPQHRLAPTIQTRPTPAPERAPAPGTVVQPRPAPVVQQRQASVIQPRPAPSVAQPMQRTEQMRPAPTSTTPRPAPAIAPQPTQPSPPAATPAQSEQKEEKPRGKNPPVDLAAIFNYGKR